MKIGIITFHYACNYGAVLQCLALYRTLQKLGADVDVIRYVPEGFRCYPSFWRCWGIRSGKVFETFPKKLISVRHGPGMKKVFDAFRGKWFTFSQACTLPDEIANAVSEYDGLITGSDQVWFFDHPAPFFLEWGHPYNGKRISYAPCCGRSEQQQQRVDKIREWLGRFDHISVRNNFSKELIEPLVERAVPVVADPTLLIDLSSTVQEIKVPASGYILMYTLGEEITGGHETVIQEIRRKVGNLPVVAVISSAHMPHVAPWADIKIWEAGPAEWLYLIANAAFVYTDSFHGVLFSIRNERPFIAYYAEKVRSPRMMDLSARYHLGPAIAGTAEEAVEKIRDDGLDCELVNKVIDEHVQESIGFLKEAIA